MPVECLYMPMHTCTWEMICCESSLQEYGIPWHWGQNRFPLPSDKMINLFFFGMSNSDYEQLKQYIRACKITAQDFSFGEKKYESKQNPLPLQQQPSKMVHVSQTIFACSSFPGNIHLI